MQLDLFCETPTAGRPQSAASALNLARANAEYGHLIGRSAMWMRLYSIETPPKRAKVFVERRGPKGSRVQGTIKTMNVFPAIERSAQ